MESPVKLTRIDPKPMSESPPRSSAFARPAPATGADPSASVSQDSKYPRKDGTRYEAPGAPDPPGLAIRLGPESKIPDDPTSPGPAPPSDIPRVTSPQQLGPDEGIYGPNPSYGAVPPPGMGIADAPRDIKAARSSAQYHLSEFTALLRQRREGITQGPQGAVSQQAIEERLRWQQGVTVAELTALIGELKLVVKEAEGHRWRRWLVGGAIGAFIPLVRRIFRRREKQDDQGSEEETSALDSANDTEYAFHKSKGILSRIKDGLLGTGRFAQIAFFVFAVLYVFSNEITLRVARTVQKRLRKLVGKIERGEEGVEVEEGDKILEGWRWRILLW